MGRRVRAEVSLTAQDLDTIFGTPTSKHVLSIPAAGLKAESLSSRVELEGQVLEASGIWVVLQVLSWPDGGWLVSRDLEGCKGFRRVEGIPDDRFLFFCSSHFVFGRGCGACCWDMSPGHMSGEPDTGEGKRRCFPRVKSSNQQNIAC